MPSKPKPTAKDERDEFSRSVREAVAKRAHYFCSHPDCLKATAGPHSRADRGLDTGVAAHIHAAKSGGPRYNPNQGDERKEASNAIWLCHDCSDLVDKDEDRYPADLLRQWKADHERMISEVRLKGYSESLRLLQARALEPQIAHRLLALLEDRRVLWVALDAESPSRVRFSLDLLRGQLADLRGSLGAASPLDEMLYGLQQVIVAFFDRVEHIDLNVLQCDGLDPKWLQFREALAALRKTFGLQLAEIVVGYDLKPSVNVKSMFPAVGG
jgi:hypothetical protein